MAQQWNKNGTKMAQKSHRKSRVPLDSCIFLKNDQFNAIDIIFSYKSIEMQPNLSIDQQNKMKTTFVLCK